MWFICEFGRLVGIASKLIWNEKNIQLSEKVAPQYSLVFSISVSNFYPANIRGK